MELQRIGGRNGLCAFACSVVLRTIIWNTALWKCDKELFQWFVDLMYFYVNQPVNCLLKKERGWRRWGRETTGKQLVFSNRQCLLQNPCHLLWFTRVCFRPPVALPTSILWKLAEESTHLCKKVVLTLWLMWLKKIFIPTVELFYIFCCPSYQNLSILHIV